jgi:hypothetical protein
LVYNKGYKARFFSLVRLLFGRSRQKGGEVPYVRDAVSWDMTMSCSSFQEQKFLRNVASIFRARDFVSPWFATRMYSTVVGQATVSRLEDNNARFDVFTAVKMKDAVF